jgi:hypothetical protein
MCSAIFCSMRWKRSLARASASVSVSRVGYPQQGQWIGGLALEVARTAEPMVRCAP